MIQCFHYLQWCVHVGPLVSSLRACSWAFEPVFEGVYPEYPVTWPSEGATE